MNSFCFYAQNTFPSSGSVGIGTTSPSSRLDIVETNSGDLTIPLILKNATNAQNTGVGIGFYTDWSYRGGLIYLNRDLTGGPRHSLRFSVNGAPSGGADALVIKDNGNIGIGTTTPDSKLSVNGNIHTKEVKVDLSGWSDFVFEKGYELPTLEEVANHIAQQGHLKNIPSAAEVKENGILVGEMNAKLLQKIEELTLYLIAENKQNTKQQEVIQKQAQLIEKLEKRMEQLEDK